ncbi:MAG TPA: glycosyltransferase family 9 protein, partial [Ferruginibacter sp.]|nr:glycosyltransferase family 9 protein [Ferruginibacter sp.]
GDNFELMLNELKAENFDYIIDLHHNLRTLRVKRFLKGVKSFSYNKLNVEKFIYTKLKINLLPKKHIVDRNIETVKKLGVVNDGLGLDYFIPEKDVVQDAEIPMSHKFGYIAIVIGATMATKKLPLHKLKELCAAIDHPIILLGGKEDLPTGYAVSQLDDTKIYNACGKFNLNESADLVRKAKLVISHDTGLMHIAAAFQRPVIAVWGNTVPEFGMYPYYGTRSPQEFSNIEVKKLSCRPCSKIGYDKCPKKHFKCMEQINIQEISSLAIKYLGKK